MAHPLRWKCWATWGWLWSASHTNIAGLETNLPRLIEDSQILGNRDVSFCFPARTPPAGCRRLEGRRDAGRHLRDAPGGTDWSWPTITIISNFRNSTASMAWTSSGQSSKPRQPQGRVDTFWLKYGGEDPADLYRTAGDPASPLLHMKDMQPGPHRRFGEVRDGGRSTSSLSWPAAERRGCGG